MTRIITPSIALGLVLTLAPGAAPAQVIAIIGATVHVQPGQVLKQGTVVISNGKIAYVGTNVNIPAGAKRIDGKGKVVTAGFIEASSRIGLVEVALVPQTQEGRFGAGINAAYRVQDGYNPMSTYIAIARNGGVTAAVSTPRGGLIAGTSAWFTLRDRAFGNTAVVKAPLAMYVALGNGALSSAAGSRGLAVKRLREVLDDAASYAKRRNDFERNQTRKFSASRLDLEALQPVLKGQIPLVVRAHRSSDLIAALRLARELKLRLIIEGGSEAHLIAKQLAAAKVPVILDPSQNLPRSFDHIHVVNDLATRLVKHGVRIAISTLGDAANARTIRQLAGVAVAYGLTREQALAAVTSGPANMFGVRARGTLRIGSDADVVVWSGDPFELSTKVDALVVSGALQSLETRQTKLFERYRKLR